MRTRYLLAIAGIISVAGCQKEPDDSLTNNPSNCTLSKAVYYDPSSGTQADTAGFVYSGNDVNRVNYTDYYTTLEYSNGKVTKRNFLGHGTTTVSLYDQFSYNPDNTISKVQSYYMNNGTGIPYYSYDYTYSGGKLQSILEKEDTSTAGTGTLVNSYNYSYTYTGNNITRVIEEDLIIPGKDTIDFEFDTQANYFAKQPSLFFTDNLFLDLYSAYMPFVLSANNVTKVIIGAGSSTVTYTEENQNLKEFRINSAVVSRYTYKCQ